MRRNVLLLAGCQALMMTGNSLLVTMTALVGFALATDKALATLPFAVQLFATMMTTVPASLLMKRIGRRNGFLVGALLAFCGAGIATLAVMRHEFWLFVLGVALIGSFNGFGNYYRFAAADVATGAWRSRAVSLVMAGGVVAAIAGPNLARFTVTLIPAKVYAGSLASMLALYLLSALLLSFVRIPVQPEEESGPARSLGKIAQQPMFVVALTAAAVGYGSMVLVMTATPLAMHTHSYSFADTAFVIQWHVLGMFAPSFVTGYLINRFGVLDVMLAGALMTLGCVLTNLQGSDVLHFWIALILLGAGWNFLFIGATTLLTSTYAPAEKAKTQALNDFSVFTVVTIASLSSGALLHLLGWRAVNLAVLPLVLLVMLVILRQRLRGGGQQVAASGEELLAREVEI
jgi:MFS family permease